MPPKQTTRRAVYPGTFDPVTNGHIDILERSLAVFDEVIIALAQNRQKQDPLFTSDERIELIRKSIDKSDRVQFDRFSGLLVEYCRKQKACCIVRGLRATADFEYEFQFAHMNRRLAPEIDTVFFMTDEHHHYISSSLVKEIASLGGDVSGVVPPAVEQALKKRLGEKKSDPKKDKTSRT
jgi:pantetheine-phosphate adenylyltransferase